MTTKVFRLLPDGEPTDSALRDHDIRPPGALFLSSPLITGTECD
jgi:hypothetical protein